MLNGYKINYPQAAGTLLLAVYAIILARDPSEYRFLDRVDLVAHEAGHMLFSWFGERLMVAGGTLGQLFVPTAFTVYFFLRRELYSAGVTFFWIGQNLFNISVYIKDAQDMALPLVSMGGGDAIHDWNYLLSGLGLLHYDRAIGNLAVLLGLVIMIGAVLWCGYLSFQDESRTPD